MCQEDLINTTAGRSAGMRAAALEHVIRTLPARPGHAGAASPSSSAAKGLKILISGQDPS